MSRMAMTPTTVLLGILLKRKSLRKSNECCETDPSPRLEAFGMESHLDDTAHLSQGEQ